MGCEVGGRGERFLWDVFIRYKEMSSVIFGSFWKIIILGYFFFVFDFLLEFVLFNMGWSIKYFEVGGGEFGKYDIKVRNYEEKCL